MHCAWPHSHRGWGAPCRQKLCELLHHPSIRGLATLIVIEDESPTSAGSLAAWSICAAIMILQIYVSLSCPYLLVTSRSIAPMHKYPYNHIKFQITINIHHPISNTQYKSKIPIKIPIIGFYPILPVISLHRVKHLYCFRIHHLALPSG